MPIEEIRGDVSIPRTEPTAPVERAPEPEPEPEPAQAPNEQGSGTALDMYA